MSAPFGADLEADLKLLERKLKLLKLEYDQYFLGSRPTEPHVLRGEVQKIVTYWSGMAIGNTALRYRFNTLCARLFSMRRQWGETMRKIEEGTYLPHQFRKKLHERERTARTQRDARRRPGGGATRPDDVFQELIDARLACGQDVAGMTREKVDELLQRQEAAIRQKFGVARVSFRIAVEDGKAKIKASPVRD